MAVGKVFPKLRYKIGRVLYSTLGAILNYFEEPLEPPVVRCNDECPKTPFKGVQVIDGESVRVFVVDNSEGGKRTQDTSNAAQKARREKEQAFACEELQKSYRQQHERTALVRVKPDEPTTKPTEG